jgi:GlcNAc-PI de-N-acetylase
MLSKATFLGSAAGVALPLAATTAEPSPSGTSVPTRAKLKVVVTGGHPGDPEYGCGGTIARYADLGHEVVLLYLNRGEWPGNPLLEDAKSVRIAEAKKACQILKARPAFAGQLNGAAIVDAAHYEKFQRILEAEQPNLVFTHLAHRQPRGSPRYFYPRLWVDLRTDCGRRTCDFVLGINAKSLSAISPL